MDVHPVDLAIIAAYFVAMIGIGIYSVRMARSREDYLVAGRRLKLPLYFGCIAALAVGGAVTVGGTQKGYETGVAGLWVGGSLGMGLVVLGMLVSSKLNRLRALSINEVIERNYGTTARVFGALLTIIYTVALTVVQVVAMGSIAAGLFDMDKTWAMVMSGAVVVFYTFLGGMWSVTLTDLVQFIIKTLGVMVLVPVFVLTDDRIGGWDGLWSAVPESHTDFFAYGFDGSLYWVLLYVPGLVIGQDVWQRVFTAKDSTTARTGTIAAGLYSMLYAFGGVMLGLAVLAVGIQLDDPALAFETGVAEFVPTGAAGLLLAAALAASMSVASGTILACSTVVYNDLYLRFVRGVRDAELEGEDITLGVRVEDDAPVAGTREVWVNRCIALVIGVLIVGLSVMIDDIFKALDLAYGFLSGAVFIPVIASFLLQRVSPRAGLVTLGVSALVVAGTMAYGESTGQAEYAIGGNWPITFGIGVGFVVYTLIHLTDRHKVVPNTRIEDGAADLPAADPAPVR
ncbi:sodium:solute symporter [Kytococcus sedentarius]|uniref:sodium:solute symporter family transporter n=1 Tax=Kytococcus sedentarius TaxID=1276 RepID=UPI0035BBD99C